MKKKRKQPIVAATKHHEPKPFRNIQEAHDLIAKFHTLNKDLGMIQQSSSLSAKEKSKKEAEIRAEMDRLGGLERYQKASLFGEAKPVHKFNAAKWVTKDLLSRDCRAKWAQQGARIDLLDVGAIMNHYKPYASWISCTAIDLHSMDAEVKQIDFFDFVRTCERQFRVVVLSLVVNFVGAPVLKGKMLIDCEDLVELGGLLYIVLPLACLQNSRYLKHTRFVQMLRSLGFVLRGHHTSTKLAFYVFERSEEGRTQHRNFSKKLCRAGKERNNFCILIKHDDIADDDDGQEEDDGDDSLSIDEEGIEGEDDGDGNQEDVYADNDEEFDA
jgi:25S rRNA (adenine2142-N1)-methyltransferase